MVTEKEMFAAVKTTITACEERLCEECPFLDEGWKPKRCRLWAVESFSKPTRADLKIAADKWERRHRDE